ncbi:MAG: response regulator [Elusimicrobia bacterium]|nr:response regulator [Elusimicrobiota bacterium]
MTDGEGLAKSSDKLVMIVDDDESVRDLLEFVVKKEGFRVETAGDGEEGLNKIQALLPDVILLDLMLPRYGGFEVLRQLQSGETARIPILIITGRSTDRTTVEMIRQESNVIDFMEKPLKPVVLAMALHRILKTHPPEFSGAAGGA